ncbi:MAG: hypothetical protein INR65_09740, partial [Gluconacetobacter diazotrophicus]|nr:hypothetical protein [Gluconacetobacter diazotrophicus]
MEAHSTAVLSRAPAPAQAPDAPAFRIEPHPDHARLRHVALDPAAVRRFLDATRDDWTGLISYGSEVPSLGVGIGDTAAHGQNS